ncbi:MAG TPA: PaaI family thioesterase [Xanthomonadales bacterium]|nr:PaaI family thioesterase [Xanthomonadales bacterium]
MSQPSSFEPRDPHYKARVTESFGRQPAMSTLGASLVSVEPGMVEIELAYSPEITQQHGFVHAGIVSAVIDSACGYAALSLMPENTGVLSIEFKVNLMAPAQGDRFRAIGRVRKAGRTIYFAEGELIACHKGSEKVVATLVSTLMCVTNRPGVSD